ncbi:hypothetical protein D3C72_2256970 [compost metagenome]
MISEIAFSCVLIAFSFSPRRYNMFAKVSRYIGASFSFSLDNLLHSAAAFKQAGSLQFSKIDQAMLFSSAAVMVDPYFAIYLLKLSLKPG